MDRRSFLKNAALTATAAVPFTAFMQRAAHAQDGKPGVRRGQTAGYGPLFQTLDRTTGLPLIALPAGFEYLSFGWVGDPLDIIASGPTVADPSTPAEALRILQRFYSDETEIPAGVRTVLTHPAASKSQSGNFSNVTNHVIGSNSVAVAAASDRATSLGYDVVSLGSENEGTADGEGIRLAGRLLELRTQFEKVCLLSGGEPTVTLTPTDQPRKGGRNQQLALSALCRLTRDDLTGLVLLSGGTDGEDGPTDAAGAFVDATVAAASTEHGLNPQSFLDRQNAYPFFEQTGGLLKTGPTGTNVMDLRVGLARK